MPSTVVAAWRILIAFPLAIFFIMCLTVGFFFGVFSVILDILYEHIKETIKRK